MSSLVINHPLYVKAVASLERTAFRDKLLRLIQYFSRFLSYYCYRKGYSTETITHLKTLNKQLSLARKAFRAGRPLSSFRAAIQELGNQTNGTISHITSIVKNLGSGFYLTLDTLVFLNGSGAYKFRPQTARLIQDNANRFWLLSILAGLVDALSKTHKENERIKALTLDEKSSPAELKAALASRQKNLRLIAWNVLDAIIPLSGLGLINVTDGAVGLAGTITAYMGLKDVWSAK